MSFRGKGSPASHWVGVGGIAMLSTTEDCAIPAAFSSWTQSTGNHEAGAWLAMEGPVMERGRRL